MAADDFGWNENSRQMIIDTLNFSEEQVSHIEEELGTSMHGTFGAINEDTEKDYTTARTELGSDGRITLTYSGELSEGDLAHQAAIAKSMNYSMNGRVGTFLAGMNPWDTQLYLDFVGFVARDTVEDVEFNSSHRKRIVNAISKYEGAKQKAHTYGFPRSFDNLYQEFVETDEENSRIVKDEAREKLRNRILDKHRARRETLTRKAARNLEVFPGYRAADFIVPEEDDTKDALYYMKGFEDLKFSLRNQDRR
ncbi:MAG: hypothetical protein ABEJ98_01140 [Candidatus Nanohaloarchaea archaeon]